MRFCVVVILCLIGVIGYNMKRINDDLCRCILVLCPPISPESSECKGITCVNILNGTVPDPNGCSPIIYDTLSIHFIAVMCLIF